MGFFRTVCALVAVSAGVFYLTSASNLSDNGSWSLIGITFVSSLFWVLLGGRGTKPIRKNVARLVTDDVDDEVVDDLT